MPSPESPPGAAHCPAARRGWYAALGLSVFLLLGLDWLLARLLWLPLFFGLFFFLVAGLIVGGVSFRAARAARPLTRRGILLGAFAVATVSTLATVGWEYVHISGTIGDPPAFAHARNAARRGGSPAKEVGRLATDRFKEQLAGNYPPGGPIGYVRWAVASGEMDLEVSGFTEKVSIDQRGLIWPLRTAAALLLTVAGLWLSFESLRSPMPISNVLAPGEEYEEID